MMDKKTLILDFDGVIVNTIEAICYMYNRHYDEEEDFIPAKWWEVNAWNFTDECPLMEEQVVDDFFDSPEFFKCVKFMHWADEFIPRLAEIYNIKICSTGTTQNLIYKGEWIKKHLPCVTEFIGVNLDEYKDKSHIDMTSCIFVDDSEANLFTSNAETRICFGDLYSWNENWTGRRIFNWTDLYLYLT